MKQTYSNNYLQKLMMKKTYSDDEFLGADTEISPHVIDFCIHRLQHLKSK
jgi:hypothetical protein